VSSKSRTGALVAKSKPMRDTFAPARSRESWVLTLAGRSIRVYPGVSGLPGVSGFTPDIPGLKVVCYILGEGV
jgi:hypothetical protein